MHAGKMMDQDGKRLSYESDEKEPNASKYPWYVYLIGGYSLTGLFSWYLLARQFWIHRRRQAAACVLGINIAIFAVIYWSAFKANVAWWRLETSFLVFNLAWSFSAWCTQYKLYGPCQRRLNVHQWKKWLTPLAIAIAIGASISVAINLMPAISQRFSATYAEGMAPRSLVLWKFFTGLPVGLSMGALLGLWWAGERRFSTSHITSFLFGLCLVAAAQIPVYALWLFLVHGADKVSLNMLAQETWKLVPYGTGGWRQFLIMLDKFDYIGFVVVGLLFGAPDRIRAFLKRAAVVIPIIVVFTLPLMLFAQEGWKLIQGQIVYQLASPVQKHRDSAFSWLEVMLKRFPNHSNWPYLALRLADYRNEKGEIDASRKYYQEIIHRFGNDNEWKAIADKSRAIVAAPKFGQKTHGKQLAIPVASYQTHLTQNWMALMSILRYLNGPQIPESDIAIHLMDISKSEDRIDLPKLTDLADLDDAAISMGYEVLIMPSDPDTAKRLIENDIPVLLPVFRSFYLLYGFDDSRSVIKAYCFGQLSSKVKHRVANEVSEILLVEAEGKGESEKRIRRIALEAQCEWPLSQWEENAFSDAAPLMAVVYTVDRQPGIDRILGNTPEFNKQRHGGYLAALIGLSFANRGDPMACFQWAQKGAQMVGGSFPLHVAYIGQSLWETRTRNIGVNIGLMDKFTVLSEPVAFFNAPSTAAFAKQARERFSQDLKSGQVPWNIRSALISLLDHTDPEQRAQLIELVQYDLTRHPSNKKQWHRLADLYALEGDMQAMSKALMGACSAGKWDAKAKLSLAAAYVKAGRVDRVEELLKRIDPQKVPYEADYPYCLGVVAEAKGRVKAALRHYETAIDLCRYRPDYHLRYAKLLIMDQGYSDAAQKALVWAARIDSDNKIREEAIDLLSKIR
jgi:tetratricopeptide (TPR) repeat protein